MVCVIIREIHKRHGINVAHNFNCGKVYFPQTLTWWYSRPILDGKRETRGSSPSRESLGDTDCRKWERTWNSCVLLLRDGLDSKKVLKYCYVQWERESKQRNNHGEHEKDSVCVEIILISLMLWRSMKGEYQYHKTTMDIGVECQDQRALELKSMINGAALEPEKANHSSTGSWHVPRRTKKVRDTYTHKSTFCCENSLSWINYLLGVYDYNNDERMSDLREWENNISN
jgi:hypothetical protein